MGRLLIFLIILISSFSLVRSQNNSINKDEMYPAEYTFEQASKFCQKEQYEKAVWFYINLFPDNKTRVIDSVKAIAVKLDTVEMSTFIKISFASYATFDPQISHLKNGKMSIDGELMKMKGSWGDELIQKITDPDKPLSSASEYNFRGLDKANAGDFSGAIEDFDKAIEIKPSGQIYFNRAFAKSMINDYTGAINDYDKTIELEYRLAEAYFERGYCKESLGFIHEAIIDYSRAIETNSKYAEAYNNRGITYMKQKNY